MEQKRQELEQRYQQKLNMWIDYATYNSQDGFRTNLKIPFRMKDEIKIKKGKWDPEDKCWYFVYIKPLVFGNMTYAYEKRVESNYNDIDEYEKVLNQYSSFIQYPNDLNWLCLKKLLIEANTGNRESAR